jgi:molecular chaperone DnaK
MIYEADKVVQENAERVPADVRSDIEAKKEALRNAAQGGDVAAIRRAMDEFNEALQRLGQAVYQQAGGTSGGSGQQPGGPGQKEDDVVDAEYREVK